MDLLRGAYAAPHEDEEDQNSYDATGKRTHHSPALPGRYVSKRQRAAKMTAPEATHAPSFVSSAVRGSISDADLPSNILSSLKCKAAEHVTHSRIPQRCSITLTGHSKAVNTINWCPTTAHLLASVGMDRTVHVWNVWGKDLQARTFHDHNAAVMDVRWSHQGMHLLSCGYDNASRLFDVERGMQVQHFQEDQVVRVVRFHPDNSNIFLSGGSNGSLRLWDVRANKVVKQFVKILGPILDVEIDGNGKQFVSSSDVSRNNLSENSIIVWDMARQVPLSNQVCVEAYTCPCIRYHPFGSCFVAQSNGNYIAIFSSKPPFKLDKYKRYEKHGVAGFPVKCNFNLKGDILVSGSSDGCLYFYDYKSSDLLNKITVYEEACIDVAYHPSLPNVVAASGWNGVVSIFE